MGLVYRAIDHNIGRTVALKTMRLDVHGMDHDEMLRRFRYEAKAAGAMNHPNIVTVYDADEVDGLFYIAMEYLEGQTLQSLMMEKRIIPSDQIVEIAKQVAAGLDYATEMKVIHRPGRFGFIAEAAQHFVVIHAMDVEPHGFEGYRASNIGIYRSIDEAHRAAANFAYDLVTSNFFHRGHHATCNKPALLVPIVQPCIGRELGGSSRFSGTEGGSRGGRYSNLS